MNHENPGVYRSGEESRRRELIEYMANNPHAKRYSIMADGHMRALEKFFRGINHLRIEAGQEPYHMDSRDPLFPSYMREKRRELRRLILEHPGISRKKLHELGYKTVLKHFYKGRINNLRRAVGLPPRSPGGPNNPWGNGGKPKSGDQAFPAV